MSHQFAPVSPLEGLRGLAQFRLLGHYQLLIAPIVLERPAEYREFFLNNPNQLVILDNGVIELGYPLDPGALWMAAKACKADVVVLPDTIDDGAYTAKQARHALEAFYQLGAMAEDGVGHRIKLMGVVQGKTLEECIECAKSHVEAGVDWLAVPRGLTPNLGSRVQLTVTLAEAHGLPIHVLGFSDNLDDDIKTSVCHDLVRGIDAATPTWLAMDTSYMPPWKLPLHPPSDPSVSQGWGRRPINFWNAEPTLTTFGHNVESVRRWQKDAALSRKLKEESAAGQGA